MRAEDSGQGVLLAVVRGSSGSEGGSGRRCGVTLSKLGPLRSSFPQGVEVDYTIFAETEQNVCPVANQPPHKRQERGQDSVGAEEVFHVLALVT